MSAEQPRERPDEDDPEALAAAEAALRAAPSADSPTESGFQSAAELMAARAAAGTAPRTIAGEEGGGRRFLLAFTLAALVFIAFLPALSAGFVNWDDDKNFIENVRWRGLGPSNLAWMFTSFHMAHWHPVTWISLGLDHVLFGGEPQRMHVVNVVYHALAALAAFGVARILLRAAVKDAGGPVLDLAAFFAAAFFAVHPVRAESVAWLTERRDVLSGLFFFLALRAWLGYVRADEAGPRRKAWIWSLVLFALAGMSKVAVFVLPFLLLVLDFWPLDRARLGLGRLVKEKLAHFAVAAALMAVAFYGQRFSAGSMYGMEDYPLSARCVQAGFTTFFYPFKTLKPTGLSPMYELPPTEAMFTAQWLVPAIIGVVVALAALGLWKKAPALSVAWLCFLVTIAPTSGLTQAGSQIAADRYSYLACIAFAFLAGGVLFFGIGRARVPVAIGSTVGAVIVSLLVWRCHAQSTIWRTSESLWLRALELAPKNTVALSNLAEVRMQQSDLTGSPPEKQRLLLESIARLHEAFGVNGDPRHLLNAAAAMRKMAEAEPGKAQEHRENAWAQVEDGYTLAKAKSEPAANWNRFRAELLIDLERVPEALTEIDLCVEKDPGDPTARSLLGTLLVDAGRPTDAIPHLRAAIEGSPGDYGAWAAYADACVQLKQYADARKAWQRVLELRIGELGPTGAAKDDFARGAQQKLNALKGL